MTIGGWIWMLVWIGVVVGMVWLIVASGRREASEPDPTDILRARYARGEISESEFRHARDTLAEQGGTLQPQPHGGQR